MRSTTPRRSASSAGSRNPSRIPSAPPSNSLWSCEPRDGKPKQRKPISARVARARGYAQIELGGFGLVGLARCNIRYVWKWGSGGLVLCTGRGYEFRCVRAIFVAGFNLPTGRFFGVVAPLTRAEAIFSRGGSNTVMGLGMVAMPDRSIAVGCATCLVTQPDELGQALWKAPRA